MSSLFAPSIHPAKITAIRNARIIDPGSALEVEAAPQNGLLIVDGKVRAIGERIFADQAPPAEATIIEGDGQLLMPGLVDMRVTVGEPGLAHKETITTASAAAAAGGVTAMVCLPTTDPVIQDAAGLEFIARRARGTRSVKFFAYAAATKELQGKDLTEYGLLSEAGALAFTDGGRAIADAAVMARALSYAHNHGRFIIQHPEEPALAADGQMNAGETATRIGLKGIPRLAEVMMIERDLRLVEMTGARLHIAHISTSDAVEAIRAAKARGLPVTCDTAPHYFALTELDVVDYRTFAKVSPPLRNDDDRQAIAEAVADGTIDAIASDHMPEDQDAKRLPFAQAEPGVIGVETLLPVALDLYHKGLCDLPRLISAMTCRPADILGLGLGRLRVGDAADCVLVDPDEPWRIDAEKLRSKAKNSAFDKRGVSGRVLRTLVDGRTVFSLERGQPSTLTHATSTGAA